MTDDRPSVPAPAPPAAAVPPAPIEAELGREMGLVSALAIGIGTMIAAGIFTLSGLAVGYVGTSAIVAFLLAAGIASLTALSYCEFASIYPESGEGYLYARKTFPAPLAYLGGWCLVLGYIASCAFYVTSFSVYFNEFVWHLDFEPLSGLVMVGALTLLNVKGTKETAAFQVVITAAKVALLIWFVAGGLGHVELETLRARLSTDLGAIFSTAALVFVTFFGFSAVAASAGEVVAPTRTVPRAIFISVAVVTVIYALVVVVILAAGLTEYTEAAMGRAAERFLGPVGGLVIVGGALFSMVSASNASILAGSRVALAMSQLGHLPRELGAINARTRTPAVALLLVGTAIGGTALVLPLEQLANFANCVLLLALVLVNLALIVHRRKFPALQRPFRVPLVPVLPLLGIAANLYLLASIRDTQAVVLAGGALLGGFLGFLAWKGWQPEEEALPGEPSRVALERAALEPGRFRVLVPLAHPGHVEALVDIASAIARAREGGVVALRVALVPEQVPLADAERYVDREHTVLEAARARAREHGVPCTALVRVGRHVARAVLETGRERECDLVVLGWKGWTSTARRILGEVTDDVVNHARSDLLLVKLVDGGPFRRLLLPTAGGMHARRAEEYAADLARFYGGSLTLLSVLPPQAPAERLEEERARLEQARERVQARGLAEVATRVVQHASVPAGVLQASEEHDAIVLGAAETSFSLRVMFGTIPEQIARDARKPVIVVKRHHPVKALLGRVMTE